MTALQSRSVGALAFVCVLILPSAPRFHAQQGGQASGNSSGASRYDPHTLDIWFKAIDAHRPGEIDDAARTVEAFNDATLRDLVDGLMPLLKADRELREHLVYLSSVPRGTHADIVNWILKRGTILHTDLAFLAPRRVPRALGTNARGTGNSSVVMMGQDGQFDATSDLILHLIVSRSLLNTITPDPAADDAVRAWYYATASILEGNNMLGDARLHIDRALELFPADPVILFFSGTLHEMLAGPTVQGIAAAAAGMGYTVKVQLANVELQEARQFFSNAVKNGTADPEVMLHLGRTLGLLGDHQAAIGWLTRAMPDLQNPALRYDAGMFLAAEYEAVDNWDDARLSLLKASALFPKAQSALVALSRLRHRQGDTAGTIAPLDILFGLRAGDPDRDDPWWHYPISHARNSLALLANARRRLAGGAP